MNSRAEEYPGALARLFGALRRALGLSDASVRESIEDVLEEDSEVAPEFSNPERNMLRNLLRFGEVRVDDIMVPRADIEALDDSMSLSDILARFAAGAHSRMPVYHETLDHPRGFIHIKDIVIAMQEGNRDIDIDALLRQILYVPPSMPAIDMLQQMQASRIHMALVIDEYGGTDGLISIEDVVEEIVGEIEDEHDDPDAPLIKPAGEAVWEAQARLPVAELEEVFGLSFDTADFVDIDTVGGMVFAQAGRVPRRGEIVALPASDGTVLEAIIREADARRIRNVEIRLAAQITDRD